MSYQIDKAQIAKELTLALLSKVDKTDLVENISTTEAFYEAYAEATTRIFNIIYTGISTTIEGKS